MFIAVYSVQFVSKYIYTSLPGVSRSSYFVCMDLLTMCVSFQVNEDVAGYGM